MQKRHKRYIYTRVFTAIQANGYFWRSRRINSENVLNISIM